jgi:hypothetical protein
MTSPLCEPLAWKDSTPDKATYIAGVLKVSNMI